MEDGSEVETLVFDSSREELIIEQNNIIASASVADLVSRTLECHPPQALEGAMQLDRRAR